MPSVKSTAQVVLISVVAYKPITLINYSYIFWSKTSQIAAVLQLHSVSKPCVHNMSVYMCQGWVLWLTVFNYIIVHACHSIAEVNKISNYMQLNTIVQQNFPNLLPV